MTVGGPVDGDGAGLIQVHGGSLDAIFMAIRELRALCW